MNNLVIRFFVMIFIGGIGSLTYADNNSLTGYWKTVNELTNKQESIIHITEQADHTLSGQIVKIFPRPGDDIYKTCTACQGENHNKRILGMTLFSKVKYEGPGFAHGEILNPENGKYYQCNFSLVDANTLNVRGYIGIALFGRSQDWYRVA